MRPLFAIACALLVPSVRNDLPRALPKLPVFEGRAIALTAEQSAALARGEPAVQSLDPKDGRVTAVFGIVAIKGTRKAFMDRLTSLAPSVRSPERRSFGVFKTPATPANVGAFTVSANDVSSLRKCRAGKCEFKLPAAEIARAKAILDSGGSGPAKLAAFAQRRAAEYVNAYRERGNAAMVVYDDYGKGAVRASDAFAALLAGSTSASPSTAPMLRAAAGSTSWCCASTASTTCLAVSSISGDAPRRRCTIGWTRNSGGYGRSRREHRGAVPESTSCELLPHWPE